VGTYAIEAGLRHWFCAVDLVTHLDRGCCYLVVIANLTDVTIVPFGQFPYGTAGEERRG
jgi:hypothetical protein